jgi:Zn-dependent protease with chaperone function
MLRAFAAQSILHALVAGLLVEAFLAAWRVDDGRWRLRLRLLALGEPVVVLPAFLLLPWRHTPSFAASWALFSTERWNLLRVGGAGLADLLTVLAAGAGAALFLRDAAPPLLDALRRVARSPSAADVPPSLATLVERHALALGIEPPAVRMLRLRTPVLLCEEATRPTLVVSTATIDRLSPPALDAAVAHELAHAAHRDPAWGYVLIAARALAFFNPATQWVARAAVDDIERRADQVACRLAGRPDALGEALRALLLGERQPPTGVAGRFERIFWRARVATVERRCARLATSPLPEGQRHGRLELTLAAAGIVGLLFFVV